jgi:hypothetical protein
MRRFLLAIVLAIFMAAGAGAADLAKIERVVKKEPAYRSGQPKYCLLVFGPQAKTCGWSRSVAEISPRGESPSALMAAGSRRLRKDTRPTPHANNTMRLIPRRPRKRGFT